MVIAAITMKWMVGCSYGCRFTTMCIIIPAVEVDLGYYLRYYVTCANAKNTNTTIRWYGRVIDAGNSTDMPLD